MGGFLFIFQHIKVVNITTIQYNYSTNKVINIKTKNERIAIIPVFISSFDESLMVVVEIGSGLIKNKKANINKVVTMYPKSNLEDYLEKMNSTDILYKTKKETTGT